MMFILGAELLSRASKIFIKLLTVRIIIFTDYPEVTLEQSSKILGTALFLTKLTNAPYLHPTYFQKRIFFFIFNQE